VATAVHVIDSPVSAEVAEGSQVTVTGSGSGCEHQRGCSVSQLVIPKKESSQVIIVQGRSPSVRTKQFSVAHIVSMVNSLISVGRVVRKLLETSTLSNHQINHVTSKVVRLLFQRSR
jgi:hypothetical protein